LVFARDKRDPVTSSVHVNTRSTVLRYYSIGEIRGGANNQSPLPIPFFIPFFTNEIH
jgi:hypothetical protein